MAVPGYQDFMLPILRLASDGKEHSVREVMAVLAQQLQISKDDQEMMLPSGTQTRYYNRVTWAVTYLRKSLLLEKSGRGAFRITPRGREVLASSPARIDNAYLERFAEYQAFKTKKNPKADDEAPGRGGAATNDVETTPDERMDAAYVELRESLADELLQRVREGTPKFFEHLVLELLVNMGYGGTHGTRAKVTGQSGDDGIDGVIPEDQLGLDMVYIQAKKWENTVGPGEIDKFVGSLMRKKAHKGVFITSGLFTDGAKRAAHEASSRIVLIDGETLAELMIDHGVGVADHKIYKVKRLDSDYFETL